MKSLIKPLMGIVTAALILNEIRGIVLAIPVMVGMWKVGGDFMALWLGFCTLAGIALSVIVPALVARRFIKQTSA